MDVMDLVAPGYHLGCLESFLGVPWDHFGDHGMHFRTPGAPKSEPKSSRRSLDCQGRLLKNSGQILEDVSLDFARVVRF